MTLGAAAATVRVHDVYLERIGYPDDVCFTVTGLNFTVSGEISSDVPYCIDVFPGHLLLSSDSRALRLSKVVFTVSGFRPSSLNIVVGHVTFEEWYPSAPTFSPPLNVERELADLLEWSETVARLAIDNTSVPRNLDV